MSWLVLAVVLAGQPAGVHSGSPTIHPAAACCVIADLTEPGDLLLPPSTAHGGTTVVVPRSLVAVAPVIGRAASRPAPHRIPPDPSDDEPPQRSA